MPNPKLETYKNKATGTVYDYTDAAAQAALAGILDGTDIDSFSDVESALADKVDVVTGKGLSTNDYDNTAKGIVDNIQSNVIANTKLIKDTVGWSGKNKIWADYYDGRSKTMNGITATVNNDGSITFNGTATGTFGFVIFQVRPSEFHKRFKVGDKCTILGCPANGSAFTYYLRLATDPWAILGDDYGEGKNITITDQSGKTWVKLMIGIDSGQTMNNVTFYPMICDTDILDKTFESPFSSTAFPRSEQAVLGAKNLAPIIAKNVTDKGITLTFNEDGSVIVSGTATEAVGFEISSRGKWLKNGERYKLSGCKGGSQNTYKLDCVYTTSGWLAVNTDEDEVIFTANNTENYVIRIVVYANVTMDNVLIKPMVRLATDPDPTYARFAMTNEQLTDAVNEIEAGKIEISGNSATFNVPLIRANEHAYTYGLITFSGGLYHFWLKSSDESDAVVITKIIDANSSRTLSATYANGQLSLTFSATIYGGVMVFTSNV